MKFKTLFEIANDIIVYADGHGKILSANGKVQDILGYKPEEAQSWTILKKLQHVSTVLNATV